MLLLKMISVLPCDEQEELAVHIKKSGTNTGTTQQETQNFSVALQVFAAVCDEKWFMRKSLCI